MQDNRPVDSVPVWRLLLDVQASLVDTLAAEIRRAHRLTITEFDVLINLDPKRPLRHRELTERVVLSRSALTRMITRLEQRGLVTRLDSPEDSRGVLISLTDDGVTLRRDAGRLNARLVRQAFSNFTDADLNDLERLLAKIQP